MKKLFIAVFVLSLITAGFVPAITAESSPVIFAGGEGTAENPYQIENVDQLLAFAESVNSGSVFGYAGQYICLTADIDLNGIEWNPIGNMSDMETMSTAFMGDFNGQGHTITNLHLTSDAPLIAVGLFGFSMGSIHDLIMTDSSVECTNLDEGAQAFGIVVGYSMFGSLKRITVKDSYVAGLNCSGGIAGGFSGNMEDCHGENITIEVLGDNDFSNGLKQYDVAECGGLLIGGGFGGTVQNCSATGTIIAEGNEPVGLGGIGGSMEMMDLISGCSADVTIISPNGGHAIGGIGGYAGTHSDIDRILMEMSVQVSNYPSVIENCDATVHMEIPGATHVGGLIGTGLYFFGEETVFSINDCSISGEINGAVDPGAVVGRAEGCIVENVTVNVTADGEALTDLVGQTSVMYESLDQ